MNLYPGDEIEVGVARAATLPAAPAPHEQILRIVSEYVTEANDFGGLDANDLVTRLETAGFTLPDIP